MGCSFFKESKKKTNCSSCLISPGGVAPGERREDMTLAGRMTIRIYDSEIREVYHDLGYWIINQTYWYPDNKYTEETAKEAFLNREK